MLIPDQGSLDTISEMHGFFLNRDLPSNSGAAKDNENRPSVLGVSWTVLTNNSKEGFLFYLWHSGCAFIYCYFGQQLCSTVISLLLWQQPGRSGHSLVGNLFLQALPLLLKVTLTKALLFHL